MKTQLARQFDAPYCTAYSRPRYHQSNLIMVGPFESLEEGQKVADDIYRSSDIFEKYWNVQCCLSVVAKVDFCSRYRADVELFGMSDEVIVFTQKEPKYYLYFYINDARSAVISMQLLTQINMNYGDEIDKYHLIMDPSLNQVHYLCKTGHSVFSRGKISWMDKNGF